MREPVFEGSGVAIVTPFAKDGSINFPKLGELIDFHVAAKTDAVVICGTTGESSTQSLEEHMAAVDFCVQHTAGRMKVIAGAGSNDTNAALMLSKSAKDSGADATLLVTPYYNKATQTGLIKHYTYIADRVDIPMILYNVPSRTGLSFTAETYAALAKHPNINGVKEASGNFSLIASTRALCGDDFYIWSGNDDQVVPLMALGGKGVISVLSNILPEVTVQMTHACLAGNYEEGAKLQIDYMKLVNALFCEVNPIPVKAAMNLMGFDVGGCRLPLCEMTEKNLAFLKQTMLDAGIAL
ncbi:MAG: 4-hydroxy-tetrahydrodipicolinate synthase [Oscillospiraceae bacterium]|nr:4-hydroxy-tetrahydrodipicolinate synthase [Oscillospiraceae bacterium]